ncbi:chromosome partitioning protein ParA [Halorubrum sp. BOL3-1]|uniref:nucleotide-binding protein n=1 Tax=Halorubrum sp. BOL3-1 TaxID=2497325 RepID=UPI001004DC47|nr:chromosome partitioning protein ParA [Halorubrum sp. BOL3-1]QAU13401.1 chromosome partitioning protein ParA [Halorubrum sp. BOL3-1]
MILAVAGGKGGVGKTTLAYNLAAELDGIVVDADLGMADLPDGRGPDLHDVLAGAADPVETVRPGPVDVVPCGRTLAGARASDLTQLAEAVTAVEREFGTVVLDCPAGRRADAGVPIAVADACLLVVSPRAFALADAIRTRELARELDAGLVGCAVNRATDPPPVEAIGDALGAPVEVVPADPRVGRSVAAERPVVDAAPDSEAAAAVRSLARRVPE